MSGHVEKEGIVVDSVKGILTVDLDGEFATQVKVRLGGKMRQHKINVVVGDRVRVKLSPYDLTNGFIVRRLN